MDRYFDIILAVALTLAIFLLFIVFGTFVCFFLQFVGIVNLPWVAALIGG